MVVRLQNTIKLLLSHAHQVWHVLSRRYLRPWVLIQLKVLKLLINDLIGARTCNVYKIWIEKLSLMLLVISQLHYLLLQRVYLLLLMELTLLLCSALAQIMAHQLVTQVLHRVWCLRQIIYQATHPYGCWCVRLQIHNLVGL